MMERVTTCHELEKNPPYTASDGRKDDFHSFFGTGEQMG